jgi:hypothetical protein
LAKPPIRGFFVGSREPANLEMRKLTKIGQSVGQEEKNE